jgi:hypothetical protein
VSSPDVTTGDLACDDCGRLSSVKTGTLTESHGIVRFLCADCYERELAARPSPAMPSRLVCDLETLRELTVPITGRDGWRRLAETGEEWYSDAWLGALE